MTFLSISILCTHRCCRWMRFWSVQRNSDDLVCKSSAVLLTVTMMLFFSTILKAMSRKKSGYTDTRQNTSAAMRPRKCKPCKVLNIEWNIAASVCVENMFVARQRKIIYTNRDQFRTEICFTYTLQFFSTNKVAFYDEIVDELFCCW